MDDSTIRDNLKVETSLAEQVHTDASAGAQDSAIALPKNPGIFRQIAEVNRRVLGDFYNTFRLVAYLAEANYSEAQRSVSSSKVASWFKLGVDKPGEHPILWRPDWKISAGRGIVNIIEMAFFMCVAGGAWLRDRKKYRDDIGDLVATEAGIDKNQRQIQMRDMLASENPIVQSAMNRFKTLYTLRFLQPLTFLWGLKLGVNTTVMQIVAERAAYFERNTYDQLKKLLKEVDNNQWGEWSRDALVAQLVNIVQQNRAEHKAPSIGASQLQSYFPLLQKLADRMVEKKYHFADVLYVLGQVIKEPGAPQKAFKAFDEIEAHGLSNLAQMKVSNKLTAATLQQEDSALSAPSVENHPAGSGFLNRLETNRSNISNIMASPSSHAEKVTQENSAATASGIA